MSAEPAPPTLLETASRIEQARQASERRIILWILLLQLVILAVVFAFGIGAYQEQRDLLAAQEEQLDQLQLSIEENRQTAAREAAAQDRVLLAIGDRLVPRSEVRKLEAQVVKLRREARMLRRAVRQLNRLLAARAAVGGG